MKHKPVYLLWAGFAAIMTLGLGGILFSNLFRLEPAFAQGTAEIAPTDDSLQVRIRRARTDDPLWGRDPGQGQHVARCTAKVVAGKSVKVSIYNGYPGYTCTLQLTLENRGQASAHSPGAQLSVPLGLSISAPHYPGGLTLAPGQREEQMFAISVQPSAQEGSRYYFFIKQSFAPLDLVEMD